MLANLLFPNTAWHGPALLIGILLLAALAWGYRPAQRTGWPLACLLLKTAGIAALLFCLLDPAWLTRRARPGANLLALVADNSEGLRIADPGASQSRGEALRAWLTGPDAHWQADLDATFELRRHLFDTRLRATRDFSELTFDGRATALAGALRTLADAYAGRPLAGILLFTDGNATDIPGSLPDFPGLPPVYPVIVGQQRPARDLSLDPVHVSQSAFEDSPVTLQATLRASGLAGQPVLVELLDRDGSPVESQRVEPRSSQETLPVRFVLRTPPPGISFHQVRARLASESAPAPAPVEPGPLPPQDPAAPPTGPVPAPAPGETLEATLANNTRGVAVERGTGPYRILYVGGRPNWEYKFLNRALEEDDQIELTALIRVARREPKFEFRGRAGETSNPLFRGFGDQAAEETVRYDQPVLVRLNARDETHLAGGFPRVPEELFEFHGVVLDDVEAGFFGADQATLLQRFVSERGGGLLLLGGMEMFREGGYDRTPIGNILPVYLDARNDPGPSRPVTFRLTREGFLQSWTRLRATEPDEAARRERMPPFTLYNAVSGIKPGASLLGEVVDSDGRTGPALVTQRYGRGRSAALTLGDLWLWGMQNPEARTDLNRTWRQLMRWLVVDSPDRVEIALQPATDTPQPGAQVEVRVRDATFLPVDDATVLVTLEAVPMPTDHDPHPAAANMPPLTLRAEPALDEPGLYRLQYVPRHAGGIEILAVATDPTGVEIGRARTGWISDPSADEFRSLTPNVALMETLARRTGGRLVTLGELPRLAAELPTRSAPVMDPWARPLWHTPLLFALALGCLAGEWGIRRWKGLP